jgi:hypothetical protein
MPIENNDPAVDDRGTLEEQETGSADGGGTGGGTEAELGDGPGDGPEDEGADGETTEPQDVSSLPGWAQKLLKKTRDEAAKARTAAKQKVLDEAENDRLKAVEETKTSVTKAVMKALGLDNDEETELTPEQVIKKISTERDEERRAREERDSKYRDLLVEVAVQDAANMHGADPSKLLDSRGFMSKLKDLDVDDDAYRVAVAAAVQEAVAENTSFRVEQKPRPPAVSGGTAPTGVKGKPLEDMTVEELRKAGLHRSS